MSFPGQEMALAMCEAYGLDPDKVLGMRLDLRPGDLPVLTVEYFGEVDPDTGDLRTTIGKYELKPVEP